MKVGVSLFTQNHSDWERFDRQGVDEPQIVTDQQIFEEELRLAESVEPLGFDSIWAVEHHFSPLNLTPSPLTFLSFLAGRTRSIDIGTMVIVLPWHDPLRVAEEISMLDNMLQGRRLSVGFGRGLARREFEPRQLEMSEARSRFREGLEIIRRALTQERFAFEGEFYRVAETALRPRPRNAERLIGDFRVAGNSPETIVAAAAEDLGLLLINAKPWDRYQEDVTRLNELRAAQGLSPSAPSVVVNAYCTESDDEGWEGLARFFGEMTEGTTRHYEWDDTEHFRSAVGYEHYAGISEARQGRDPESLKEMASRTQVWGTPRHCLEQLRDIADKTGAGEFIIVFKYGSMPYELAKRSLTRFGQQVLPEMHEWRAGIWDAGDRGRLPAPR